MSSSLPLFLWCIISWNMHGKRKTLPYASQFLSSFPHPPVESKGTIPLVNYLLLSRFGWSQASYLSAALTPEYLVPNWLNWLLRPELAWIDSSFLAGINVSFSFLRRIPLLYYLLGVCINGNAIEPRASSFWSANGKRGGLLLLQKKVFLLQPRIQLWKKPALQAKSE